MNQTMTCAAHRRGRTWVAHVPEHGVYGHGRTLKALRASMIDGLAHVGVSAELTLVAVTPELEYLRSVQDTWIAAWRAAVITLALRSATPADIAVATGTSTAMVKQLLAEQSRSAAQLEPVPDADAPRPDPRPVAAPPTARPGQPSEVGRGGLPEEDPRRQ